MAYQSFTVEKVHVFLGHAAVDKLYSSLKDQIHFARLFELTHLIVKTCTSCLLSRVHRTALRPLNPHQVPQRFGEWWVVDHISLCRPTSSGYKNVLICVDAGTNYVEAMLCKTTTASETARHLVSLVCHHNLMIGIISDLGPAFANKTMRILSQLLGSHFKGTSSSNPRSSGHAEVYCKLIKHTLRNICSNDLEIEDKLQLAVLALNTSYNTSLGCSPFFAKNGVEYCLTPFTGQSQLPAPHLEGICEASRPNQSHVFFS